MPTAKVSRELTIVTACDQNYAWGAFLLCASLRYYGVTHPIRVLARSFSPSQISWVEQFEDVKVIETADDSAMQLLKPRAILQADSPLVCWMDADCIVTGDVSPMLQIPENTLCLRMRDSGENRYRFGEFYAADESDGIPQEILDRWKQDVGESSSPRFSTACVTNCIIVDQQQMPFMEKWAQQIEKVCNSQTAVQDRSNHYYSLSDEDVLASLLCYSETSPELVDYPLNRDPDCHLVHFIGRPKPWQRWTLTSLQYRKALLEILDWVASQSYELGPMPAPFKQSSMPAAFGQAYLGFLSDKIHSLLVKIFSAKQA